MYLVAVMDWHSRRVLSWRVSNTLDTDFCVDALEEALARHGTPEIFNTEQGCQFTSQAFTGVLEAHGVTISMDGVNVSEGCPVWGYSLKRWTAHTRYLDDSGLPIDSHRVENLIRPKALGRSNWLFAGSLRSGQRAANIMSLIQSAKLNGHEPYGYLKGVPERLPTQTVSQFHELLPHHWQQPA